MLFSPRKERVFHSKSATFHLEKYLLSHRKVPLFYPKQGTFLCLKYYLSTPKPRNSLSVNLLSISLLYAKNSDKVSPWSIFFDYRGV